MSARSPARSRFNMKGWLLIAAIFTPMILAYVGLLASRDSFVHTRIPRIAIACVGAVIVGAIYAFLTSDARKPLQPLLPHIAGAMVSFGAVGFGLTFGWLTALPRFTSTEVRTFDTAYERTSGWKNCRFGARFPDSAIAGSIKICGEGKGLSETTAQGYIRVTEAVSPYGVQLLKIEPIAAPG